MDGPTVGQFGKASAEEHLTRIVTNGVNIEEKLCGSIMKGLARRNRERLAMLAEMEEENQVVVCVEDITGKELSWHAVRKAREQEIF